MDRQNTYRTYLLKQAYGQKYMTQTINLGPLLFHSHLCATYTPMHKHKWSHKSKKVYEATRCSSIKIQEFCSWPDQNTNMIHPCFQNIDLQKETIAYPNKTGPNSLYSHILNIIHTHVNHICTHECMHTRPEINLKGKKKAPSRIWSW